MKSRDFSEHLHIKCWLHHTVCGPISPGNTESHHTWPHQFDYTTLPTTQITSSCPRDPLSASCANSQGTRSHPLGPFVWISASSMPEINCWYLSGQTLECVLGLRSKIRTNVWISCFHRSPDIDWELLPVKYLPCLFSCFLVLVSSWFVGTICIVYFLFVPIYIPFICHRFCTISVGLTVHRVPAFEVSFFCSTHPAFRIAKRCQEGNGTSRWGGLAFHREEVGTYYSKQRVSF